MLVLYIIGMGGVRTELNLRQLCRFAISFLVLWHQKGVLICEVLQHALFLCLLGRGTTLYFAQYLGFNIFTRI